MGKLARLSEYIFPSFTKFEKAVVLGTYPKSPTANLWAGMADISVQKKSWTPASRLYCRSSFMLIFRPSLKSSKSSPFSRSLVTRGGAEVLLESKHLASDTRWATFSGSWSNAVSGNTWEAGSLNEKWTIATLIMLKSTLDHSVRGEHLTVYDNKSRVYIGFGLRSTVPSPASTKGYNCALRPKSFPLRAAIPLWFYSTYRSWSWLSTNFYSFDNQDRTTFHTYFNKIL